MSVMRADRDSTERSEVSAGLRPDTEAGALADRQRLAGWLASALGADELTIDTTGAPPLNGASNDTLMLTASWVCGGARSEGGFVVRRPPAQPALFHHYDLGAQFATMAALAGTDVPVPPLVGYEPDASVIGAPFYVMREVAGQAPPDLPPFTKVGWVLELTPAEQAQLYASSIEMLARVHRLDPAVLNLTHLAGPTGTFADQLEATLAWHRWARELSGGRPNPVLDATADWLIRHQPAPGPVGLNWGDARLGNMLYRDLAPVAVLDWEMAALGPAEVDLGWWLFLNRHHTVGLDVPWLPGFPSDDDTVTMWEDAAGRKAQDVFYYDVLAGLRFGIIVARASRRLVDLGQLPEEQGFERVNGATTLLAGMLDLPLPA